MMIKLEATRQERAEKIAQLGELERVSDNLFYVHSQTSHQVYTVTKLAGVWNCSCPDCTYRHVACKHIIALQRLLEATVE